ncbi:MAG: selenium metabolism-associated LysR family transcriptional regulator [Oscillospiraceae bacterium]|nr:selenium metabolism-associated LysR family transcriptional regulator [Oscillospiraceae bacterium]
MELKQLRSFTAVVQYGSFTKAAEKMYTSQPTISTHIRALEEELQTPLIVRDTKNMKITPKGWELYECATHILELQNNLLQRWSEETKNIIRLGASTIPSAYILPEILPRYGKLSPDTYFIVQQSDSSEVISGLLNGLFDLGMVGMECPDDTLCCVPFYSDHMVLIAPVNERFLAMKKQVAPPISELLREPIILREKGSGSQKSADRFLESMCVSESDLKVTARMNDQESIKNLVAGGLGISIISEKAAKNFVEEKRLLMFDLPEASAKRNLYLIFPRTLRAHSTVQQFADFILAYYHI